MNSTYKPVQEDKNCLGPVKIDLDQEKIAIAGVRTTSTPISIKGSQGASEPILIRGSRA